MEVEARAVTLVMVNLAEALVMVVEARAEALVTAVKPH